MKITTFATAALATLAPAAHKRSVETKECPPNAEAECETVDLTLWHSIPGAKYSTVSICTTDASVHSRIILSRIDEGRKPTWQVKQDNPKQGRTGTVRAKAPPETVYVQLPPVTTQVTTIVTPPAGNIHIENIDGDKISGVGVIENKNGWNPAPTPAPTTITQQMTTTNAIPKPTTIYVHNTVNQTQVIHETVTASPPTSSSECSESTSCTEVVVTETLVGSSTLSA